MATVTFKNLCKSYSGDKNSANTAVNDLSFTVEDRELFVIVGPSGCGKSSLLRMVAGLENVSTGEIYIDDHPVNDLPGKDRDVAMVFQNYALFPHMSVFDNLAFGLKLRKASQEEINRRVAEVAQILELQDLLQRSPRALSGGQRQRVALGRAIVRQPKVFLLDEPLSNLDNNLRDAVRLELIKLHRRLRATMLYVTHDQTDALTMGDRICVMQDGNIVQIGTPEEIYQTPTNQFVAGFFGSPEMNFLSGKITNHKSGLKFRESGDGTLELELKDNPELGAYTDQEVTLGMRPESLTVVPEQETSKEDVFQVLVDVIEPRGGVTNYHLHSGEHALIAQTSGMIDAGQGGRRMRFRVDQQQLHFFDPQTSQRIG